MARVKGGDVQYGERDAVVEDVAIPALSSEVERANIRNVRAAVMCVLLQVHPATQVEELVRKARGCEEYILGP
jgi:hypothetical protein